MIFWPANGRPICRCRRIKGEAVFSTEKIVWKYLCRGNFGCAAYNTKMNNADNNLNETISNYKLSASSGVGVTNNWSEGNITWTIRNGIVCVRSEINLLGTHTNDFVCGTGIPIGNITCNVRAVDWDNNDNIAGFFNNGTYLVAKANSGIGKYAFMLTYTIG